MPGQDIATTTYSARSAELLAVHRYRDNAELGIPELSRIVGNGVDTRVDTMRRRLGRDRPA